MAVVTAGPNDPYSAIVGSLIPSADNAFDMGSSSERWATLYLGTSVSLDNGSATVSIDLSNGITIPYTVSAGSDETIGYRWGSRVELIGTAFDTWDVTLATIDANQGFTRLRITPGTGTTSTDLAEISLDASVLSDIHANNYGRLFLEAQASRFLIAIQSKGTFVALPLQVDVIGRTSGTSDEVLLSLLPGDSTHVPFWRFNGPVGIGGNISTSNNGTFNSLPTVRFDQDFTNTGLSWDVINMLPAFTESSAVNNGRVSTFVSNIHLRAANTENWTGAPGFVGFRSVIDFGSTTNVYTVSEIDGFLAQLPTNLGSAIITQHVAFHARALTLASTNYLLKGDGAGLVSIGDTTDATSLASASLVTAGGIAIAKSLAVGTAIGFLNGIATVGLGVPAVYGVSNRKGLTTADGSPITLYTTVTATGLFRITLDIFATAFTSGTATLTITWTQNSVSKTLAVTATALNTLGTATDLINPDTGTAITVQLTGTFTATVDASAVVEQLVA